MTRDDDIAYVRTLAEEGRRTPLLSGPVLVAAAVIFGGATLAQWAIETGLWIINPWAQFWTWIGAGVLFGGAMTVILGRMKRKPGYNSVANTAVGAAWSGIGFLIFAAWLGMAAMGLRTGDWGAMQMMPSLVFAAYGAAWTVAAAMSGQKWINAVALASYAGAVLLGAFAGQTAGYIVFVGLLAAVVLVPGLMLMRREPSETV